jgi:hypothetical protein
MCSEIGVAFGSACDENVLLHLNGFVGESEGVAKDVDDADDKCCRFDGGRGGLEDIGEL